MSEVLHTKFGNARISTHGYYVITTKKEGNCRKFLHRLIYEDFWGVKLVPEVHIHHKDGNRRNNCILNLEAMSNSEHSKHHHTGENHYNYGKKESHEHKRNISKSSNTSGYFNVSKRTCKECKQGFTWTYRYHDENNNRKTIVAVDIEELKRKVLDKGLIWEEYDE